MMSRYAAKIDANQPEIVDGLKAMGCSVEHLAKLGKGAPDLAVGFRKVNFLFEIANPETRHGRSKRPDSKDNYHPETNKAQRSWYESWRGTVDVVETFEQARSIILARTGRAVPVAHF